MGLLMAPEIDRRHSEDRCTEVFHAEKRIIKIKRKEEKVE